VAGRFDIERRAASGASGDIFRALDRVTGRAVALKLLRRGPTRDDARFEREARILADLHHPRIVTYVAHGVDDGGETYLATEWLDGESLSKRLAREPPLTLSETLTLGARVAKTLGAAHERGIIHRDLTPSNLFLPGGAIDQVKLLDFGVSRPAAPGGVQLTVPGDVVGTPGYMAPEQARGSSELDARADVFSLGCLLFRCLTGRLPFEGRDMVSMLLAVISQEPPRARDLNPAIPETLSDLLASMLSKSPGGRPLDGNAVAAELARIAPGRLN
jgi:serine/threonine-protein kinase